MGPHKKNQKVLLVSKLLSAGHKIRIFRTFIEPILLYNSETLSLTTTLEKSIDSFHRRLLRTCLNYRYPKKISSDKLYTLANESPLSDKIGRRRLALLGHILRLHPETPAQKALRYYVTPHPRPVRRPPLTWIALVTKDLEITLKSHKIKTPLTDTSLNQLQLLANDKNLWRVEIARCKGRIQSVCILIYRSYSNHT